MSRAHRWIPRPFRLLYPSPRRLICRPHGSPLNDSPPIPPRHSLAAHVPTPSLAHSRAAESSTSLTYLVPTKGITGAAHGIYAWADGAWSGPLNTGLPTHLPMQYGGIAVNDTDPSMWIVWGAPYENGAYQIEQYYRDGTRWFRIKNTPDTSPFYLTLDGGATFLPLIVEGDDNWSPYQYPYKFDILYKPFVKSGKIGIAVLFYWTNGYRTYLRTRVAYAAPVLDGTSATLETEPIAHWENGNYGWQQRFFWYSIAAAGDNDTNILVSVGAKHAYSGYLNMGYWNDTFQWYSEYETRGLTQRTYHGDALIVRGLQQSKMLAYASTNGGTFGATFSVDDYTVTDDPAGTMPRENTGEYRGLSMATNTTDLFLGSRTIGAGWIKRLGQPDQEYERFGYAGNPKTYHVNGESQVGDVESTQGGATPGRFAAWRDLSSGGQALITLDSATGTWGTIPFPAGRSNVTLSDVVGVVRGVPPAADTSLPDDQTRVSEESPLACVQSCVGGPINTRSGNLWTSSTDLVVSTPGPRLAWSRTYISQATDEITATGPLGTGWQHPFATRIITEDMAYGEPGRVIVLSPKGNRLRYSVLGNGQFAPFPGVYHTLVQGHGVYTQTMRDQSVHVFDAATGRLTTLIDPRGNQLDLVYAGDQLMRVEDAARPTDRFVTLSYDANNRIATVSDGSRTVSYSYDANDDLVEVRDVLNRPTRYAYQNHLLTRVENALGQPLEITEYETPHTADSKALRQTLQDGRHLELTYTDDATTITTTSPDGSREVEEIGYAPDNTRTFHRRNGILIDDIAHDANFSPAQVVDANGNQSAMQFTATGLPEQVTNALGDTTQVQYNAFNQPVVITDTLGRRTDLAYDDDHNLIRMTSGITTSFPLGFTTRYTYNVRYPGQHWLEAQQTSDGVVTRYTYDDQGYLTHSTLGDGTPAAMTTAYGYDALGRVITTTIGVGTAFERHDVTHYRADNTVAESIQNYQDGSFDPAHPDEDVRTTYGYDDLGRQVWVQDALGHVSATRYNAQGQVETTVRNLVPLQTDYQGQPLVPSFDPAQPDRNVATQRAYDGLGRTILVTQTGILTGTFSPATRTFDQAIARVTRTDYDDLGRPLTVTLNYRPDMPVGVLPDINVQTLTMYDAAGNITWMRDAAGRWTHLEYDALNRPVTTTVNYENGDPLTVDPDHRTWTDGSDTDLRQVTRYRSDGATTQQIDNYVDGVFQHTEPVTDRITAMTYDALGRLVQTHQTYDPATQGSRTDTNRTMTTAYDPATGRVLGMQDALGRWSSQTYDAIGRVVQTTRNCTDGAGTPVPPQTCAAFHPATPDENVPDTTTYDAVGRTATTEDALGHRTWYSYDGLGRVVMTIHNYVDGVADPAAPADDVTTTTTYDALGRVVARTDAAGATTRTAFNGLGHTAVMTDAMQRVTRMGTDGSGMQRWSETPDGRFTVQQVDGLGRTIATIHNYQDGIVTPDDATDQDLVTRTHYDVAGRRYETVAADGTTTRLTYDLLDRLIVVTEHATDAGELCDQAPCNVQTHYAYDRAGNRLAITDANGHTRRFVYDAANRQVQAIDGLGVATGWTYDAAGRRTAQDDPRGASNDITYTYDGQDRLVQLAAQNLAAPIEMRYNALGWRTALEDSTGTTIFGYDGMGRVTEVTAPDTGTVRYGYDARGQRTQLVYPDGMEVVTTFFADGQQATVQQGTTTLASATYDGAGRLATVARANGAQTEYTYDGANRLVEMDTTVGITSVTHVVYTVDRAGNRVQVHETRALPPQTESADDTPVLGDETAPTGGRVTAGLRALYTFDEGSGTTVADVSGVGAPLDLTIANPQATTWVSGSLIITSPTIVQSSGAATKIITAVQEADELTLEAWVTPATTAQDGPARIVTISDGANNRNTTLGQGLWGGQRSDRYDVRLRSTATSDSGTPSVTTGGGTLTADLEHVVYTRDVSGTARIYINNVLQAETTVGGDLSNWDASYPFALANEIGTDRPWLGAYHLVAVYNRALTADEVTHNFRMGTGDYERVEQGIRALYTFDEGSGTTVADVSGVGAPLNLTIADPQATTWLSDGLVIASPTIVQSSGAATKIITAAQETDELTLEAWVTPANDTQDGPARIVTMSDGSLERNVTLGQGLWGDQLAARYDVRFRSSSSDLNGQPSLTTEHGTLTPDLEHVVYTRDVSGTARIYINSVMQAETTVDGDLSNWDASFPFALANEVGAGRPWLGTLHLVAVYNRALEPTEVTHNFRAGAGMATERPPQVPAPPAPPVPTPWTTRTITYTYDGLHRLTGVETVTDTTSHIAYTYDLAGNRTALWHDGQMVAQQSYNAAHQVIGWSYDAAGNLLNDGTGTYTYDALNRLVQHTDTTYAYNGDGILVQAGDTHYTQDLAAPLAQVLHDGNAAYVYGHERLAAIAPDGTRTWYLGDALGSMRLRLDDAGIPLDAAAYTPFGIPHEAMPAPFGFTGELHDAGLVYLRARWYNPGRGTFATRDPFAGYSTRPNTLHPYMYAANTPVRYTDPSGRCYDQLGFLRDVEPGNCHNLDMAITIFNHPHASLTERTAAYAYISTWTASHSMLLVGAGFGGGALLTESVLAAGAAATDVSLLGAAALAHAPATVQTAAVATVVVADKVDDVLMYVYAALGDEQAVAEYQALQQLGTSDPSPVCDVLAAGIMLGGRRGGVSRYHSSLSGALERFAEEAPAIQSARGMTSWGEKTWKAMPRIASMSDDMTFFVHVNDQGKITGAMTIGMNSAGELRVGMLEALGNGAGTSLLQTAAQESVARGLGGRFTLEAADQAVSFYKHRGGKYDPSTGFIVFDEVASRRLLDGDY